MTSRWIRLDTTWDSSKWIAELPAQSQLAWVKLLCYMKAHGDSRSVKALSPKVAARKWGVTVTHVNKMLSAAIADKALLLEGAEWVITGWHRQTDTTNALRQSRYRERQKGLAEPVTPVTPTVTPRNDVTPTETETGTVTKEREKRGRATAELPDDWTPNDKHAEIASAEGVNLDRAAEMFRDHAAANGRTQLRWDQAFNNWLRSPYNQLREKVKSKSQATGERLEQEMGVAFRKLYAEEGRK